MRRHRERGVVGFCNGGSVYRKFVCAMSDDSSVKLGFVDQAGDFVTFDQIAKTLPKKYPSIAEIDLPTGTERAVLKGLKGFYDFFQVIYVDEDRTAGEHSPDEIGWYWVTYFYPRNGYATIGPFSNERRALTHACSHALPLNDPRREKYECGYIGSHIEMLIGKAFKFD